MKKFVALFAMSMFATAFAAPNLTGDWKLNAGKSDFGPAPAPETMERTIKHTEPAIQYTTHQKGAQGEVTSEIKYTTDGKECVNKVGGGEAKGTAKWLGDNLLIESTRDFNGAKLTSKELWTLSSAGKVLTIDSHITVPQGEFDIKIVFDKQ